MALEDLTGTKYIDDLVATNPTATDDVAQGDDHIRGLKNVLKLTLPNVTGAITPTHTELNYVDGVTSDIQTQLGTKLPLAGGTMTGNITMPSLGTVDGRDISVDGTKLDTIATSANLYTHPANHAISVTTGLQAALDAKEALGDSVAMAIALG